MDGIIPARAGFTRTPPCHPPTEKDHPRSRGVYGLYIRWPGGVQGSSPLARGLPTRCWAPLLPTRIIPARAGFTSRCSSCMSRSGDHPRSRGVYRTKPIAKPSRQGSSPLARGLRRGSSCSGPWGRIIPARAGFTSPRATRAADGPDHPRSRGVYRETPASRATFRGSSPLARGLLVCVFEWRVCVGIIPARAGFTHRGRC